MQVVILAGGAGTRAYPYTEYLPKPMMPVGGKPVIVRVMEIYAREGITDFILSVGYRKEIITDYFANRSLGWNVQIVDTGNDTDTGGRIHGCRHLLGETFMATYADGLSDVSLSDLVAFHHKSGSLARSRACHCGRSTAPYQWTRLAKSKSSVRSQSWTNIGSMRASSS